MTAPFIIYGLARSRTAWLASFLSYREWNCKHEHSMHMRTVEDIKTFFNTPNTGSVETAAGPGFYLIHHYFPHIKAVVVRRPLDDVVASMIAAAEGIATYDEVRLRKVMAYGDRMLDKISRLPGVLTVDFSDLVTENTCRKIFEHCLPYEFDRDWWVKHRDQNIQVDIAAVIMYYHANKDLIEGFKLACRRELYRLRRTGELTHGNH